MSITTAYMYTVSNVGNMFDAIQRAQVPPRFTHSFLKTLGFKSTNDRSFINVLKGLGFLDSNSSPTEIYKAYRDKSQAKKVLGQQIKKAYPALFMADESIHEAKLDDVKGKISALTGKDTSVVNKMASTFSALCKLADFSGAPKATSAAPATEEAVESPALERKSPVGGALSFSHVIYINLPTTKDVAVYDAIFRSIREHLL